MPPRKHLSILTLVLLNPYLSSFENTVHPNQQASDQDPQCFHSACKYRLTGMLKDNDENWGGV